MTAASMDGSATIPINCASEYGRLRSVVMCQANPYRSPLSRNDLDAATWHQLRHNDIRPYQHRFVRQQQRAFAETLTQYGVEVLYADELGDIITQHYTRDVAFVIDDVLFVARPRRVSRQRELVGMRRIFDSASRIAWLDAGSIEGGDIMLDDGLVLVGLGEETNLAGIDSLRHRLGAIGNTREVIPLHFNHRGVIHLDTKLNIIGPGLALIHRPAFTAESLKWLEDRYDLIDLDAAETRRLNINVLALAPRLVAIRDNSERLARALDDHDINTVTVPYDQVCQLPGSLRCSTLPLQRETS